MLPIKKFIRMRNRFGSRGRRPPAAARRPPRVINVASRRTLYVASARRRVCAQRGARGEILTIPDTPTTQGLSLWCFNIVGGEILTIPDTPTTQGLRVIPMVFQEHSGGRDFDHPRHSHYSGGYPYGVSVSQSVSFFTVQPRAHPG